MQSKSILIALAAFALTATGAQAFNSSALARAGLSNSQIAAFEVARELREEGDNDGARDVLLDAGIDDETIEKVREAMRESRHEHRADVKAALASNDFEAFKVAIADTPLADIITTEADFKQFKEAHALKQAGDLKGAKVIFNDLGIKERKEGHHRFNQRKYDLSDSQKEAMAIARQSNDRKAMRAIMEEAGFERGKMGN